MTRKNLYNSMYLEIGETRVDIIDGFVLTLYRYVDLIHSGGMRSPSTRAVYIAILTGGSRHPPVDTLP